MFGTDLGGNGFMKSEGDLARVRWMFASIVGAAKGLRERDDLGVRPVLP
jgi:hypothetical protein